MTERTRFFEGDFFGMECCGVKEYYGINSGGFTDVRDIAMQFDFDSLHNYLGACHVLLNEVREGPSFGPGTRIEEFQRLCQEHNLGPVVVSRVKVNPNSGNRIKSAIWTPNVGALHEWAKVQPEYIAEKQRYDEMNRRYRF